MTKEDDVIARIRSQLLQLGPVLPGSISKQWNVCGTPGCKCKDPKHPRRHGPYFQLSYTLQGKSSTLFLKPTEVAEARRSIARYRTFKQLCGALVAASVAQLRQQRHNRK